MPRVQEEIRIRAPRDVVWTTVHDEALDSPRWSPTLTAVEEIEGEPGEGWRLRYRLRIPGGRSAAIELVHTAWEPPRRCAGSIVEGPVGGDWEWRYRERAGVTTVVYTMELRVGGVLRLAGGVFADQYAKGIRENLEGLKRLIEEGD